MLSNNTHAGLAAIVALLLAVTAAPTFVFAAFDFTPGGRSRSPWSSLQSSGGDEQYIHGKDQAERQDLLNSLFGPTSIRALIESGIISNEKKRILEIGCGAGATTQMLACMLPPGSSITGIDTSSEMIQAAKRRFERTEHDVNFVVNSGEEFVKELSSSADKDDALFDAVWIRFVVVHVPDPLALLRAACSCLKPGGTLLVEDVDVSGSMSDPPLFGMDLFYRAHQEASLRLGADLERGRKIGGYLNEIATEMATVDARLDVRLVNSFKPLFGRGCLLPLTALSSTKSDKIETCTTDQLSSPQQNQEDRYLALIELIRQSLVSLSPKLLEMNVVTSGEIERAHESLKQAESMETKYQLCGTTVYQWSARLRD